MAISVRNYILATEAWKHNLMHLREACRTGESNWAAMKQIHLAMLCFALRKPAFEQRHTKSIRTLRCFLVIGQGQSKASWSKEKMK